MITSVLGAPGSGKSSLADPLGTLLPSHAVLDWDAFIGPANALSGLDIRSNPNSWPAYRRLLRSVVDSIARVEVVLLGVCTPDELEGWPIDAWLLLDCTDDERRQRLATRPEAESRDAIMDARRYRSLGLKVIDTTGRTPEEVAGDVSEFVQNQAPNFRGSENAEDSGAHSEG